MKALPTHKKAAGMTLVEFTMALAILSATMLIGVAIFTSILRLNGRSESIRETQQIGRFAMENISRDIRLTTSAVVSDGGSSIGVSHPQEPGVTIQYRHEDGNIIKRSCTQTTVCNESEIINNPNLRVTNLTFEKIDEAAAVAGANGNSRGAVKITMALEHGVEGVEEANPAFYAYTLNSTVTLRQ